jgi:polysaccharide biosynthesis transport protein
VGLVINLLTFWMPTTHGPLSDFVLTRSALGTLQSRMFVKRIGLTYAIDIEFQSLNPERAAQIANAIADAYVVDALEAKYQTTRRAASWLQERLTELRDQAPNVRSSTLKRRTTSSSRAAG